MFGFIPRSLAVVGIVGALTFAMPVSAQAGLLDPLTLGPYAIGAVRAAAPVEAAAAVIGPEGTIIVTAAVMAGALAYATQDTWMPWLQGLFGKGGKTSVNTATSTYALSLVADPAPGGVWSVTLVNTGSGNNMAGEEVDWQCNLGGVITGGTMYGLEGFPGAYGQLQVGGQCGGMGSLQKIQSRYAGYGTPTANQVSWGASFDPNLGATYTVSSDCVKPDGSLGTITATTANPGAGGLLVPSCVKAFGAGSHAAKFTLNGGATGTTPHQLSTIPLPTDTQTAVLYPNCVGAGAIACTYIVDYQGVACTVGQAECVNWTMRQLAHPSDYSCFYGPYPLATTDKCAIDERVYEPNGTRLTMKNTDGDPWTYDSPAPAGMPELQPQPGTGTGTVPGTGTGTVPGGTTGTLPSPTGVPGTNGDCWSGGAFSWNPVDWVLTPIKCGLSWAFVPKTATLSTLAATAKTDLTTQGIGPMVTAVTANVSKVGGNGSGCAGPSVTFAAVGITKALTPFNACTTPMSTLASISYAMTTVVVVLGGGFAAVKAVGAGFGFNFSMRRAGGGEAA